jgi:hypothetical protein
MLSRIFWVGLAGLALITGMVLQDSRGLFSWAGDEASLDARIDRALDGGGLDSRIDRVVDRGLDKMEVVGADGQAIEVTGESKKAMADAITTLIKAETSLAMLRIGDGSREEVQAASGRRDQARAEVDRLKAQFERQDVVGDATREQIRRDIREDVREDVRETVRKTVSD